MAKANFVKEKVLFVGKAAEDFELLQGQLGHLGFRCDQATNAVEALDMLEEQDYDLIILDDSLPQHSVNGFMMELAQVKCHAQLLMLQAPEGRTSEHTNPEDFGLTPMATLEKPLSALQLQSLMMARRTSTQPVSWV